MSLMGMHGLSIGDLKAHPSDALPPARPRPPSKATPPHSALWPMGAVSTYTATSLTLLGRPLTVLGPVHSCCEAEAAFPPDSPVTLIPCFGKFVPFSCLKLLPFCFVSR